MVVKALDKNFEGEKENIKARLAAIMDKYITASRLTVGITADGCDGLPRKLIASFKNGERVAPVCKIKPLSARREGISIPARVSFAAMASNMLNIGVRPDGSFDVARAIAGYEYLWGEVRVKGGAYGAGMSAGISGNLGFYSYRDPNPKRTLEVFVSVPAFLRDFCESGADITKYIIGAVGEAESLKTPRMRGSLATARLLRGITYEENCRLRKSLLAMDKDRLHEIADVIQRVSRDAAICVVGPRSELKKLELDEILEI
jgi:Zn-dependent M16 (insulinase) family peptidase